MLRTVTSLPIPVIFALLPLGACVAYDQPVPEDTAADSAPPERPTEPGPDAEGAQMRLSPAGGVHDEVVIVSLIGDGSVDLRQATELTFFGDGDLDILAVAPRGPDEYLMTLDIPSAAPSGMNHLLIDFADGSMKFVEDAFEVVGDPLDFPTCRTCASP